MIVNNAAELSAALADAVGGDVIELAPGDYGSVFIGNEFTSPVTIKSQVPADPAIFRDLKLDGARNIIIDGIFCTYTHETGDNTWIKPFAVFRSSFITIRNSIFEGDEFPSDSGPGSFGFGYGIYVQFCDDIVVEFNEVYNFERAVNIGNGFRIVFRGNDLHSCRSEGIDLWDMHGLLIVGNYIHDLKKDRSRGDHPDLIQFWDVKSGEWSEDVTIRGNFLDAGSDWTQSIFLQNGSFEGAEYFRNFLVEHNVIYNAHSHGITCEGGFDGLVIRHNTMLYAPAASDPTNNADLPPFINVNTSNLNVTIHNNIVEKRWNWNAAEAAPRAGWVVGDQLFIQRSDPAASNSYSSLFFNALVGGASLADLRALPGGLIEATGVGADMTRMGGLLNAGPNGTVAPPSSPPPSPPPPTPDPPPDPEPPTMQISDLIVNLIDAETDLAMRTLSDGAFVDPAVLASGNATIAVVAASSAPDIGSIRLTVGPFTRLESSSPYALFGDSAGDFTGGLILGEGPQILRLEVFAGSGASGAVIGDFTIGFTVGAKPPAPDPGPAIDPAVQVALDALGDRLTAVEAVASLHTLNIASLQARIAVVEAAGVAMATRMIAVESRLTAGAAGLK